MPKAPADLDVFDDDGFANIRCPECGSRSLSVAVSTRANVRFNDDEENANHEVDDFEGDVEFDLDSHAGCRACGHSGALRFFKSA